MCTLPLVRPLFLPPPQTRLTVPTETLPTVNMLPASQPDPKPSTVIHEPIIASPVAHLMQLTSDHLFLQPWVGMFSHWDEHDGPVRIGDISHWFEVQVSCIGCHKCVPDSSPHSEIALEIRFSAEIPRNGHLCERSMGRTWRFRYV